jgi:hypothetical protein
MKLVVGKPGFGLGSLLVWGMVAVGVFALVNSQDIKRYLRIRNM